MVSRIMAPKTMETLVITTPKENNMAKIKGPPKYKSKKIIVDGIKFDSIAESEYYLLLKYSKLSAGNIKDFELQPKFILQDKFTHKKEGNIRAIIYIADFKVYEPDGSFYIVDIKGKATADALNKRKMFLKNFPDIELYWIAKSKKYSHTGWIDYFDLERIRRENRKKKGKL